MTITVPTKAELRWQCRRGMLELDIMLLSFFDETYDRLSVEEQSHFVELLACSDNELYRWLTGQLEPASENLRYLVQKIRACST